MLADLLQFTITCRVPANIVLLTDDEIFAAPTERLKMRGYNVLLIVPSLSKTGWETLKSAAGPDFFVWMMN